MKILFVTSAAGMDYLPDCLFHGLVTSGHDVTDSKYLWYLSGPLPDDVRSGLYGRGFTIAGNLPDRSRLDRSGILERIRDRYYDLVVYGSIKRCSDFMSDVTRAYPKNRVVICDGEDYNDVHPCFFANIGVCFKRELTTPGALALPISFAIPEEKLCIAGDVQKTRDMAEMIPGWSGRTYIYDKESDYYAGYQVSRFGLTLKKNGWDCMRHYEIIANKCLPYFKGYEDCPKAVMTNWPSDLQLEANAMYESRDFAGYDILLDEFFSYCKDNLTTKALADYVLSKTH